MNESILVFLQLFIVPPIFFILGFGWCSFLEEEPKKPQKKNMKYTNANKVAFGRKWQRRSNERRKQMRK